MLEPWLQQAVEHFWHAAGASEPFPRNLERPVLWALPLAIVKLPCLRVHDVTAWLKQRDIPFRPGYQNRPLHGCTIAYAGKGFILLDGTDSAAERRFSLAHEVAHFLVDYLQPRQRALRQLGGDIVEVLDGWRSPTVNERVHAILRDTPLGVHAHLMDRRSDGAIGCTSISEAEHRADRLALELLAPAAEVQQRTIGCAKTSGFGEGAKRTAHVLVHEFGLPRFVADAYGHALYSYWHGGPSIREWLGM